MYHTTEKLARDEANQKTAKRMLRRQPFDPKPYENYDRAYQVVMNCPFNQFQGFCYSLTNAQLLELKKRLGESEDYKTSYVRLVFLKSIIADRVFRKIKRKEVIK